MPEAPQYSVRASRSRAACGAVLASADRARRLLTACLRLPANLLLGSIWLYQRTLSPALPVVFGASCGCRFSPTCSHYAADAVRTHGAVIGAWLALRRLVKCTPLHPGGFDPVPPALNFRRTNSSRSRLVCRRTHLEPAA